METIYQLLDRKADVIRESVTNSEKLHDRLKQMYVKELDNIFACPFLSIQMNKDLQFTDFTCDSRKKCTKNYVMYEYYCPLIENR